MHESLFQIIFIKLFDFIDLKFSFMLSLNKQQSCTGRLKWLICTVNTKLSVQLNHYS